MKSRANLKGHPIHPILVGFPIAFFTGTLIFDVLTLLGNTDFTQTAIHLQIAGLIAGAAAAIPGIIDFLHTVPPKSSGKARAAKHGLTNVTVMLVFGAALFYRLRADQASQYVIVRLELFGEILLGIAGWMGGTLVYRNQIGVDVRYADAAKWKEEHAKPKNGIVEISDIDQFKVNQMRLIHTGSKRIVLARTETGFVAFDDRCPHKGGSLAGGTMMCGTVHCPWHGSQFDVVSGNIKAGPSKEKIQSYPVREENGKVYITFNGMLQS